MYKHRKPRKRFENLRPGDRVVLPAIKASHDFPEGLTEERGRLLSIDRRSGTCIVQVDSQFNDETGFDDLIRETPFNAKAVRPEPAKTRRRNYWPAGPGEEER